MTKNAIWNYFTLVSGGAGARCRVPGCPRGPAGAGAPLACAHQNTRGLRAHLRTAHPHLYQEYERGEDKGGCKPGENDASMLQKDERREKGGCEGKCEKQGNPSLDGDQLEYATDGKKGKIVSPGQEPAKSKNEERNVRVSVTTDLVAKNDNYSDVRAGECDHKPPSKRPAENTISPPAVGRRSSLRKPNAPSTTSSANKRDAISSPGPKVSGAAKTATTTITSPRIKTERDSSRRAKLRGSAVSSSLRASRASSSFSRGAKTSKSVTTRLDNHDFVPPDNVAGAGICVSNSTHDGQSPPKRYSEKELANGPGKSSKDDVIALAPPVQVSETRPVGLKAGPFLRFPKQPGAPSPRQKRALFTRRISGDSVVSERQGRGGDRSPGKPPGLKKPRLSGPADEGVGDSHPDSGGGGAVRNAQVEVLMARLAAKNPKGHPPHRSSTMANVPASPRPTMSSPPSAGARRATRHPSSPKVSSFIKLESGGSPPTKRSSEKEIDGSTSSVTMSIERNTNDVEEEEDKDRIPPPSSSPETEEWRKGADVPPLSSSQQMIDQRSYESDATDVKSSPPSNMTATAVKKLCSGAGRATGRVGTATGLIRAADGSSRARGRRAEAAIATRLVVAYPPKRNRKTSGTKTDGRSAAGSGRSYRPDHSTRFPGQTDSEHRKVCSASDYFQHSNKFHNANPGAEGPPVSKLAKCDPGNKSWERTPPVEFFDTAPLPGLEPGAYLFQRIPSHAIPGTVAGKVAGIFARLLGPSVDQPPKRRSYWRIGDAKGVAYFVHADSEQDLKLSYRVQDMSTCDDDSSVLLSNQNRNLKNYHLRRSDAAAFFPPELVVNLASDHHEKDSIDNEGSVPGSELDPKGARIDRKRIRSRSTSPDSETSTSDDETVETSGPSFAMKGIEQAQGSLKGSQESSLELSEASGKPLKPTPALQDSITAFLEAQMAPKLGDTESKYSLSTGSHNMSPTNPMRLATSSTGSVRGSSASLLTAQGISAVTSRSRNLTSRPSAPHVRNLQPPPFAVAGIRKASSTEKPLVVVRSESIDGHPKRGRPPGSAKFQGYLSTGKGDNWGVVSDGAPVLSIDAGSANIDFLKNNNTEHGRGEYIRFWLCKTCQCVFRGESSLGCFECARFLHKEHGAHSVGGFWKFSICSSEPAELGLTGERVNGTHLAVLGTQGSWSSTMMTNCDYCDGQVQIAGLFDHLRSRHPLAGLYPCTSNSGCEEGFASVSDRNYHLAVTHADPSALDQVPRVVPGVIYCPFCDFWTLDTVKTNPSAMQPLHDHITVEHFLPHQIHVWRYGTGGAEGKEKDDPRAMPDSSTWHLCLICGLMLPEKPALKRHIDGHLRRNRGYPLGTLTFAGAHLTFRAVFSCAAGSSSSTVNKSLRSMADATKRAAGGGSGVVGSNSTSGIGSAGSGASTTSGKTTPALPAWMYNSVMLYCQHATCRLQIRWPWRLVGHACGSHLGISLKGAPWDARRSVGSADAAVLKALHTHELAPESGSESNSKHGSEDVRNRGRFRHRAETCRICRFLTHAAGGLGNN